MADLVDIEQARRLVAERAAALESEDVPLRRCLRRVLAEPVASADPVPAFDNSAMDGFAVRAAETAGASSSSPVTLSVVGESRAGRPAGVAVGAGQAIAISTGAAIPTGADAVVRVEDTAAGDGEVAVEDEVSPGRNVRRAGEDVQAGERVLGPGTVLGPAELGVLASLGTASVPCTRRPRTAVLTTGDELVGPDQPLFAGAVRNSNAFSVPALAETAGAEVVRTARVADDRAATRGAIEAALAADVVVVCGGVSVGEHDHVKAALAELAVEQVFWGVALRPGKPTWFGARGRTLVFGLPGNPVSAMVTFLLFVRPAIRRMLGVDPELDRGEAILDDDYEKKPGRAHAVRCRLELRRDGWHARPTKQQGSHVLTSMLGADALAILPAAAGGARAGDRVAVELLPR